MSLARVHTWIAGEVLTASDLNAEFNSILNNAISLLSPLTATFNFGGFQATNLRLEVQTATQTAAAEGVIYWQSTEDSIHVSSGTIQLRVPALAGIQAGELVGITNPSGVSGATVFSRMQLGTGFQRVGTLLTVATASPALGGTGKDFSAVAQGSLIYFLSTGETTTLAPGTSGQVLQTGGAAANPSWADTSTVVQNRVATNVTIINDASERTVYTFSVPGNTLSTDKQLRLTILGFGQLTSGNLTRRIKYGTTTLITETYTTAQSASAYFKGEIRLVNKGATNAQRAYFHDQWATTMGVQQGTATEDSTGALALAVTYQFSAAASNNTFVAEHAVLELL